MIDLWHGALSLWKRTFCLFSCGCILTPSSFILVYNICCWWSFFSQGNQWRKNLALPKIQSQNLARWGLRLLSLWTAFSCCCPLIWQQIWLQSEVVAPYFIYCHIFTPKLLFVALKQFQTRLWIVHALFFFINCEQTRDPLWTQFLIDEYSCKIGNTLPSEIFNSPAISCNFNLLSAETS